jgi:hypothetical protein
MTTTQFRPLSMYRRAPPPPSIPVGSIHRAPVPASGFSLKAALD